MIFLPQQTGCLKAIHNLQISNYALGHSTSMLLYWTCTYPENSTMFYSVLQVEIFEELWTFFEKPSVSNLCILQRVEWVKYSIRGFGQKEEWHESIFCKYYRHMTVHENDVISTWTLQDTKGLNTIAGNSDSAPKSVEQPDSNHLIHFVVLLQMDPHHSWVPKKRAPKTEL